MRRKLVVLNIALIALIALAGWRLRQQRLDSQARYKKVLGAGITAAKAPGIPPVPPPQPVAGASYLEIAQRMLFSRDRNSQVIVEPAVVKEKPLPPLPIVHGVMNLGDGPTIIMGEKGSVRHRGIRVGEQFGDFKIVSLQNETLVLGWEDRQISKRLGELAPPLDSASAQAAAAGAPAGAQEGYTPAAPQQPQAPVPAGPGTEVAGGMRACIPGDNSPSGETVQGFRKVMTQTPFGNACRWEPVK